MRITIRSGSLSGCLSLVGTGLGVALPAQNWIGWIIVAAGILVLLLDIRVDQGRLEGGVFPTRMQVRKMIAIAGMIACGAGFIGFAAAYLWPARTTVDTYAAVPAAGATTDTTPTTGVTPAYDVPRKLAAIDQALDLIDWNSDYWKKGRVGCSSAQGLWYQRIERREVNALTLDLEECTRSSRLLDTRLAEIKRQNERFADISRLLEMPDNTEFYDSMARWAAVTRAWRDGLDQNVFMKPYVDAFTTQYSRVGAQVEDLRKRLLERRHQISP